MYRHRVPWFPVLSLGMPQYLVLSDSHCFIIQILEATLPRKVTKTTVTKILFVVCFGKANSAFKKGIKLMSSQYYILLPI